MPNTSIDKLNILLHPDFFRLRAEDEIPAIVSRYENRLLGLIDEADDNNRAVLLHDVLGLVPSSPKNGVFWGKFEDDMKVMTAQGDGSLANSAQCEKLWDIIQRSNPQRIVVSGSYFNGCVGGFVAGLANAMAYQKPAYLAQHTTYGDITILKRKDVDTRIELGTVLDNPRIRSVELNGREILQVRIIEYLR
ncbi:MAG TPA: hypothetical protein P5247_01735 [Candidatus Saccharimonadales bacterium]|nr:hypothetical protein [Candidatus Saccharimonadales bacterium]